MGGVRFGALIGVVVIPAISAPFYNTGVQNFDSRSLHQTQKPTKDPSNSPINPKP